MRNLAAKVPEDLWPEFKARVTAAYQAPSRAIARQLAEGLVKDTESELPSAVACFQDDLEACIAPLRMPITHRRANQDDEPSGTPVRRGAPARSSSSCSAP
jgi:putative transposase